MKTVDYYVMPENVVISEAHGIPTDMTGVIKVTLPEGRYLVVSGRGKEYPAEKIALAVARGQVKVESVSQLKGEGK